MPPRHQPPPPPPMPAAIRALAFPYWVVEAIATLPSSAATRAKAAEAAITLLAHDCFREIDGPEGRGYALCESQEQLHTRTSMSVERIAAALQALTQTGWIVKTAGRALGDEQGSEPDRYWITSVPGAYVPATQPHQAAHPKKPGTRSTLEGFAPPGNPGMRGLPAPRQQPERAADATGKPGHVVFVHDQPWIREEQQQNNMPANVTDLPTWRSNVRHADGTPVEDAMLAADLAAAGFSGKLPEPVSAAAATSPGLLSVYLAVVAADPAIVGADGHIAGYVRAVLTASGSTAMEAPVEKALGVNLHSVRPAAATQQWLLPHCGKCHPDTRRMWDPDMPEWVGPTCRSCHNNHVEVAF